MNSITRHYLTNYLDDITSRYNVEKRRLDQISEYSSMRLKTHRPKNGCFYYSIFDPQEGRYKYLGTDSHETVRTIKEARHLQMSIQELQQEILLVNDVLQQSRDISHEEIDRKLSKAYRGSSLSYPPSDNSTANKWKESAERYKDSFDPFRPNELIHTTRDGSMTRSKSEALIYNYLLDVGVTFVYELPLRIRVGSKDSLLLPDFTILSEIDYRTVKFIEHQGMLDDPKYRTSFNEKVFKYWTNNHIPERDVFFTFDLPNGGFDDTPIRDIIKRYIRPENL